MRFGFKAALLIVFCAAFAFGQAEKDSPELMRDSTSGKALQMDFTIPLAGVNDPGMLFAHFAGKPLLVFYFSPKCPHCQAVFPEMQELIKQYSDRGLAGIGISIGGGIKKNDVRLFIDQFNASFPIFQDVNAKFGPKYGTGYVPVIFVVKKDGTFYRFGDSSKKTMEQLKALLNKEFPAP